MKKIRPLSLLARMFVLALFIAPFCLNQVWYVGGGEWLYWFSSYLCYSQILIAGMLMVFVPRQFRAWLNRNPLTGSDRGQPVNWDKYRHGGMMFLGFVFISIGFSMLLMMTSRFIQECRPLSTCL